MCFYGKDVLFSMLGVKPEDETKDLRLVLIEPMEEHESVLTKVWRRVTRHGSAIGQQTVYAAMLMYYAFRRKGIPIYARSIIIGVFGYFLAVFDAIPDLTPVIGFTDDLGVLSFGLVTIAAYINDEVRIKARQAVKKVFPQLDFEVLQAVDAKL
jgi:uncharacterized membrane protein YkvA (DUF1232 family)